MARKMQFTVDGEQYVYDGKLMLPEAIAIQKATGWTKQEWGGQLEKGDVIAEAALFWVMRKRRHPEAPIEFADMDYDTNGTDITYLTRDGSPIDMEAVAARADELMAADKDLTRQKAVTQAMDEADPEPEQQDRVDPPQAVAITGDAVPPPSPSIESPPAMSLTSPTTSTSAPGSSTS